ncbi:Uncharacterised protein g9442 [Pycnogonum litorale]
MKRFGSKALSNLNNRIISIMNFKTAAVIFVLCTLFYRSDGFFFNYYATYTAAGTSSYCRQCAIPCLAITTSVNRCIVTCWLYFNIPICYTPSLCICNPVTTTAAPITAAPGR